MPGSLVAISQPIIHNIWQSIKLPTRNAVHPLDRTDICSVPGEINTNLLAPGRWLSRSWRVNDSTETAVGFGHVMQGDDWHISNSLQIRDDVTLQLAVLITRRSTALAMQDGYLLEKTPESGLSGTIYWPY